MVSASNTGTPLMRRATSSLIVLLPFVNLNSSVTWKVFLLTSSVSMNRAFRSRFSLGTNTVFSPFRYSQVVKLPSMLGGIRSSLLIRSSAIILSMNSGLSRCIWFTNSSLNTMPVCPPRSLNASSGLIYSQLTSVAYLTMGFWTAARSPPNVMVPYPGY